MPLELPCKPACGRRLTTNFSHTKQEELLWQENFKTVQWLQAFGNVRNEHRTVQWLQDLMLYTPVELPVAGALPSMKDLALHAGLSIIRNTKIFKTSFDQNLRMRFAQTL